MRPWRILENLFLSLLAIQEKSLGTSAPARLVGHPHPITKAQEVFQVTSSLTSNECTLDEFHLPHCFQCRGRDLGLVPHGQHPIKYKPQHISACRTPLLQHRHMAANAKVVTSWVKRKVAPVRQNTNCIPSVGEASWPEYLWKFHQNLQCFRMFWKQLPHLVFSSFL